MLRKDYYHFNDKSVTVESCANRTQMCGGFAGIQCCDGQGLACILNDNNGMIADASGICYKFRRSRALKCSQLGGSCGGFTNALCCTGLQCLYKSGSSLGSCVPLGT